MTAGIERRRVELLEIELDRCGLHYAGAPCLAGTDVHAGTSQSGAAANTIRLDAGASAVDDFYNGKAITEASGRRAIIVDYDGTTKDATVDRPWPYNLFSNSEALDLWTLTNATATADAIRAPSGLTVADKLEETAATGIHAAGNTLAVALNDELFVRVRVKPAERGNMRIDFSDAEFGATAFADFDLAARTAATGGTGAARILDLWDGWLLCEYTATATAAGTATVQFQIGDGAAFSYAGTVGSGLYLWGAAAALAPLPYIKSESTAVGLPNTVAFRILDAGGECYNTFSTCQDPANYLRESVTHKFHNPGAPVPPYYESRPYLESMTNAPTEISLERGLAKRANVKATLLDEPGSDRALDPYAPTRAVIAAGTHFARLLARNPNHAGRRVRILRGRMPAGWDASLLTTEHYLTDRAEGPQDGLVSWTIKDPLKLTDRGKVPAPSSGALRFDILAADTSIQLAEGDGIDYPESGWVRIGNEALQYTEKQVAVGYNFNNSTDNWTGSAVIATLFPYYIELDGDGASPYIQSPVELNFNGFRNRYVSLRFRRKAGSGWDGIIAYSTAGHGISASYYKQIADPTGGVAGDWVVAVWDMHDLTAGGTDWQDSEITQVHIELHGSAADTFDVDWISWGDPAPVASDILVMPDATYRGAFGTVAADADAGDAVQLCTVWQNAQVWEVLRDLLLESGLESARIDTATMEAEDDAWLGDPWRITALLGEPQEAQEYINRLLRDTGSYMWWDPVAEQATMRVLAPLNPEEVVDAALTDAAAIIEKSAKLTVLSDLQRTQQHIFYDPLDYTDVGAEMGKYLRAQLYIDADAESDNDVGESRPMIVFTEFFNEGNDAAMSTAAARRGQYYVVAPKDIDFRTSYEAAENVSVGSIVDLETAALVTAAGLVDTVRCVVLRRRDDRDAVALRLRILNLGSRYAFIAPDGTADYPTDTLWAHIVPDSGFFDDGTPGYTPF